MSSQKTTPEPFLTTVEVAEWLGFSTRTIVAMAERGDLPSYRIGARHRFLRSEVEAKLAEGRA